MAGFLDNQSDLGLLGGVAEGFKQGMMAYQDQKKIQQGYAVQKQKLDLEQAERETTKKFHDDQLGQAGAKQGLIRGPDQQWVKSPEQLQTEKEDRDYKRSMSERMSGLKERQVKLQEESAGAKLSKPKAKSVPGFEHDNQTEVTDPEIRTLRDASADGNTMNKTLTEIADLTKSASEEDLLNPVSDVNNLIKNKIARAQLTYKGDSFAKLGVLAGPDMNILNQIIEDPTQIAGLAKGKEGIVKRLMDLKNSINYGIDAKMESRGFKRKGMLPQANAQQPQKVQVPPNFVRVSNGKETLTIPKSRLQDALKDNYAEVK